MPLTEYVVVLEQPPKSRRGASSSSFLRCNVQRKAATGALEPIEYKKLSGMRSDTDVVFALCTEQPDLSVLLFCATKRLTLEEAKAITSRLRAQQQQQQQQQQQAVREASRDKLLEQRAKLALKFAHDEVLRETIPFGVAYHHAGTRLPAHSSAILVTHSHHESAGLTAAERARIEKAFRTNVLSILTCTSTLAAGTCGTCVPSPPGTFLTLELRSYAPKYRRQPPGQASDHPLALLVRGWQRQGAAGSRTLQADGWPRWSRRLGRVWRVLSLDPSARQTSPGEHFLRRSRARDELAREPHRAAGGGRDLSATGAATLSRTFSLAPTRPATTHTPCTGRDAAQVLHVDALLSAEGKQVRHRASVRPAATARLRCH